jgi:hypothetical protein
MALSPARGLDEFQPSRHDRGSYRTLMPLANGGGSGV